MPQEDGALSRRTVGSGQLAAAEREPADRPVLRERVALVQHLLHFRSGGNPQGWGGTDRGGWAEPMTEASTTGQERFGGRIGGKAAAGGLVWTAGNLCSPADRQMISWRSTRERATRSGTRASTRRSNGPISYELDGHQYIVVAAADSLWAFVMHER